MTPYEVLHEALSDIQFHMESAAGESWEDAYKEVCQIAVDALEKAKDIE